MFDKILRIQQRIFGIALLTFGLNGFLNFLPLPGHEGFAKVFLSTLRQSVYLFPTISTIQIFVGLSLIINKYSHLGLILLLPVSFNIFAFHLFHDWASLIPATLIFGLNLFQLIRRMQFDKNQLIVRSSI